MQDSNKALQRPSYIKKPKWFEGYSVLCDGGDREQTVYFRTEREAWDFVNKCHVHGVVCTNPIKERFKHGCYQ